jgi:hypothetical protein
MYILEFEHSRGMYTSYDYEHVSPGDRTGPFWDFIHAGKVNIIVLDERMREDVRFVGDPDFVRFDQQAGQIEDFEFVPVPGTSVRLAVRRSLRRQGVEQKQVDKP